MKNQNSDGLYRRMQENHQELPGPMYRRLCDSHGFTCHHKEITVTRNEDLKGQSSEIFIPFVDIYG
jgi:hypothetical protein